jgi:four helix bundle protein
MRSYHDLKVWQKGHQLVLDVYKATAQFPKDELYGLTSQTRRAAAAIPANIAEGCGRHGDTERARFMSIAAGSAFELDYHLLLAKDLGFLEADTYQRLYDAVDEVRRMLNAFIQKLKANG